MKTDRIITFILSVSLFIVLPFIYSLRLQDVEQSPRMLFTAAIVAVSSVITIIFVSKNPVTIKMDRFYLIVSLFLVINFVSFFRSINFGDGLFEFLKMLLFYTLFFQFIIIFAHDEKNKFVFFKIICISAFIFIAFGLLQLLPVISSALSKGVPVRVDYSISSTLGNKNFLAEVLLLMLPITLLSAFYHLSHWRMISIFAAVAIIVSVALLQTLSTWVAIFFAAIVTIVLAIRFRQKLFLKPGAYKLFCMGTGVVLLVMFLTAFLFVSLTGNSQIKDRFVTIKNLFNPEEGGSELQEQNSTYERIILAKSTLKMISDYPVMGAGLGNWKIIFPSYGMGSALYMTAGSVRFIHPHNEFLLIASESGLIGLIVFMLLPGLLLYYAFIISAKANTSKDLLQGLAIIFGLTSYIIISLVSLPSSRIYPLLLFVLFAALIISEYSRSVNAAKPLARKWITGILVLSFVIATITAINGVKRLKADFNLSAALLHEHAGNYGVMERYLEKIDKKIFPLDATATPIAWYQGFSFFYLGNNDKAFELFKEAEQVNPYHLMVLNDLGTCYNLSGDAATAERYYKKALSIQPEFGDALINLSIIYFNSGNLEASYTTLIRHRGKIMRKSIPVFSAILTAKAETLTKDEKTLSDFQKKLRNQNSLVALLKEIRNRKTGLQAVLAASP